MSVFTQEQGLVPPLPPVRPALRFRPLDPAVDSTLLIGVKFGPEPYSLEVEHFLRQRAIKLQEREICWTTLALLPEAEKDVLVGFYTTRTLRLNVKDEKVRNAMGISRTKARKMPVQIDACYLVAFGVNIDFQKQKYASEIHWHLIEELTTGSMRLPYVYLDCWCDNPAAWVYAGWEYVSLIEENPDDDLAYRWTDEQTLARWKMLLKVRE